MSALTRITHYEGMTPPPPGDPPLLCPFCRIVHGERAQGDSEPLIIGNFPRALAFIPLAPAAWGHTLVIPKPHITDLWGFAPDLAGEVFTAIWSVGTQIRRALRPDGMNLIQSTGAAAGQTVDHLHFHLVPRWDGDHLGDLWEKGREWWKEMTADTGGDPRTAMADAFRYPPS